MSDDDFSVDGIPLPLSTPDEDAWESYLTSTLEQLGADGSTGLTNKKLAELERVVGVQLPFEVGLLLVMGVPDTDGWRQWGENPAEQFKEWNTWLVEGVMFDVEHNAFWLSSWGLRPDEQAHRLEIVEAAVAAAPPLLPIYGHRCIPLTKARGEESAESNPVLSVYQTDLVVYGTDVADWLHNEFDVPLPLWPKTADRWFPLWSELIETNTN